LQQVTRDPQEQKAMMASKVHDMNEVVVAAATVVAGEAAVAVEKIATSIVINHHKPLLLTPITAQRRKPYGWMIHSQVMVVVRRRDRVTRIMDHRMRALRPRTRSHSEKATAQRQRRKRTIRMTRLRLLPGPVLITRPVTDQ